MTSELAEDNRGQPVTASAIATSGGTFVEGHAAPATASPLLPFETSKTDQIDDPIPSTPIGSNNPFRNSQTSPRSEPPLADLISLSQPISPAPVTSDGVERPSEPTTNNLLSVESEGTPARRPSPVLSAGEGEWKLKEIAWPDPRVGGARRNVKILIQNENGPCSLLALANTLILRGSIHLPQKLWSITYSQLSHLVADFLVTRPSTTGQPMSLTAALDILPTTVQGLNVNVGFDSIRSFEGQGAGGELALFERAGVELVHGWLADEGNTEQWGALNRAAGEQLEGAGVKGIGKGRVTYDTVQEAIVRGLEVEMKSNLKLKEGKQAASESDKQMIDDAHILQKFLEDTRSQLTYPGLFGLSELPAGSVVAFFRNSHLSVLYRRPSAPVDASQANIPSSEPHLFQLITDASFASDPEYTWESLVDIDGSESSFYNSEFFPSGGAGGDWSGVSPERIVREQERKAAEFDQVERLANVGGVSGGVDLSAFMNEEDRDMQLARALQEDEDRQTAQAHQDRDDRQRRREQTRLPSNVAGRAAPQAEGESAGSSRRQKNGRSETEGKQKDKKCIVM